MDVLFPKRCVMCEAEADEGDFCGSCLTGLNQENTAACARCGMTVPDFRHQCQTCSACQRHRPKFDGVVRLGRYQGKLREALLKMKHAWEEPLAAALAGRWWQCQAAEFQAWQPDVVVPIPLHWKRRWLRGANSPDVLAQVLASRLHLPTIPRLLVRLRDTQPQGRLNREQRRVNMRQAFSFNNNFEITDACVLLVDDILTTGATLNEATKVLKKAGARRVIVAAAGRAEGLG